MKKILFFLLISAFTLTFSCKKDDEKPDDGVLCLKCVGEAALCEGDTDEDGNELTKEILELAYAFAVAFEQDCTLD